MAATTIAGQRRTLHFNTLDDALTDVDRLAAANGSGGLGRCGNWTFGQSLNHLATWVDYCYDGVPMTVPLPVKLVMRPMKRWFLHKPMRAGSRIPRIPGGTLATDLVPDASGVDHVRRSFARLRDEPPVRPHLIFGAMTHAEWIAMHLRHAELHLSFFQLRSPTVH